MPSHRVGTVQHRDELVHAAHAEASDRASGSEQVDEPVRRRTEMQLGQAPPPGLDHCVAPGCVGEERRDGAGQRVRVLVRDEDPGPAEHLGHRTLVERHDGQPGGHGLDDGHAESLVLGCHDQHVCAGVGRGDRGVTGVAGEQDGVGQAELGHVAVQCVDVGVRGRLADDVERGVGVALGVGDGQGGDGALERLVGRDPADRQPTRPATCRRRGAPPVVPGGAVASASSAADGETTAVTAKPESARCASL